MALLSSLFFTFLNNAFALDCTLLNARVNYTYKSSEENTTYYWIDNLKKIIRVPVSDSHSNTDLAKALKSSSANKDVFINMQLESNACHLVLKSKERPGVLIFPDFIKSITTSYSSSIDCIDCITFKNIPMNLILPPMIEMKNIFSKSAGLSPQNINRASILLIHLFERMNHKTPNANLLIFTVALFKTFEVLQVKSLNNTQLEYLSSQFKELLPTNQYALLQMILKQIAGIHFTRDNLGKIVVQLSTIDRKTISLSGSDFPVANEGARQMLQKYFNRMEIEHGASLVFTNNKMSNNSLQRNKNQGLNQLEVQTFVTPSNAGLQGIQISGQFPVIGEMAITPADLIIDIDSSIPVKTHVNFKKGFMRMSYTFNLDN